MSFWYFINCACVSQIGSPTALSSQELETSLRTAAIKHGLYVPSGAFWGAEDIKKMADRGTLQVRHVFTDKTKFMDKSLLQSHLKPRGFKERCRSETLNWEKVYYLIM